MGLDLCALANSKLFVQSNRSYGVIMIDVYSFFMRELLPEDIRDSLNFFIDGWPSSGA